MGIYTTPMPIDNSLSGGTIFCIILFIGLILYFVIGYIISAILNRKDHGCFDISANIPHIVFWIKLPSLIVAGCSFTLDFVLALCCDNTLNSSDKNDILVKDNVNNDINPFANPTDDD